MGGVRRCACSSALVLSTSTGISVAGCIAWMAVARPWPSVPSISSVTMRTSGRRSLACTSARSGQAVAVTHKPSELRRCLVSSSWFGAGSTISTKMSFAFRLRGLIPAFNAVPAHALSGSRVALQAGRGWLAIMAGDAGDRDAACSWKRCVAGMIVGAPQGGLSSANACLIDSSEVGSTNSCQHFDGFDLTDESASNFAHYALTIASAWRGASPLRRRIGTRVDVAC